jgi:uncharacterized membrane protein
MSTFWKLRLSMFAWGFFVVYAFTRQIDLSSKVFLVQAAGNTALIWWFTREKA